MTFRVLFVFVLAHSAVGLAVTLKWRTRRRSCRHVPTAPRSPWQNALVERLIGSIRRECLDHIIVLNEASLRRILSSYFDYYQRSRTLLALK